MATKKRPKLPNPSPGEAIRVGSEIDTQASSNINLDAKVEHGDSKATPAISSVEGPDPATYRIDIERGVEADEGDVERGPA
jgi:hypothetical protein